MNTVNPSICHVTIGHSPTDDRIFYKEVLTLRKKYSNLHIVAPDRQHYKEKDGVIFHLFREGKYRHNFHKAYDLALKVNADIYHFHEFEMLPWAMALKYKYKKKVIYDAHESIFWYFIEFSRHSILITLFPAIMAQLLEWLGCLFMDHVITVTPWVAKSLRPFSRKGLTILYNYPVLKYFPENSINRTSLNHPVILYHGQLSLARNIPVIVAAMKYVKPHFPDAKLLLVGNSSDTFKKTLMAIIKSEKLEQNVEFKKRVAFSEVPNLLTQANIGISSMSPNQSFKRSIQIKPFEFMIMGIPVLGCRVPSTERYVEKVGSGLLIDPPTAENLGQGINKILSDEDLALSMGKKGKKAVKEQYNWSAMEPILYQVYRQIINIER